MATGTSGGCPITPRGTKLCIKAIKHLGKSNDQDMYLFSVESVGSGVTWFTTGDEIIIFDGTPYYEIGDNYAVVDENDVLVTWDSTNQLGVPVRDMIVGELVKGVDASGWRKDVRYAQVRVLSVGSLVNGLTAGDIVYVPISKLRSVGKEPNRYFLFSDDDVLGG